MIDLGAMMPLTLNRRRAFAFLVAALLLVAACGDGGEQTSQGRDGGPELSRTELRQLELAIADLGARIERLEAATDELLAALGDEAATLGDLPALIEELRARLTAIEVFAELTEAEPPERDEDPCGFVDLEDCPERSRESAAE